jgi:hypothetical protein
MDPGGLRPRFSPEASSNNIGSSNNIWIVQRNGSVKVQQLVVYVFWSTNARHSFAVVVEILARTKSAEWV